MKELNQVKMKNKYLLFFILILSTSHAFACRKKVNFELIAYRYIIDSVIPYTTKSINTFECMNDSSCCVKYLNDTSSFFTYQGLFSDFLWKKIDMISDSIYKAYSNPDIKYPHVQSFILKNKITILKGKDCNHSILYLKVYKKERIDNYYYVYACLKLNNSFAFTQILLVFNCKGKVLKYGVLEGIF